jgi:hypothetical protein
MPKPDPHLFGDQGATLSIYHRGPEDGSGIGASKKWGVLRVEGGVG